MREQVMRTARESLDSAVYWVRLGLLKILGPAQLDDEHDPVVLMKREHAAKRG